MTGQETREVPKEVAARLAAWRTYYGRATIINYAVGVIGVLASLLATASLADPWRSAAAITSGVCLGIMGFVNPQFRYVKFVRAWRILDPAVLRYQHGLSDLKALLDALEAAEGSMSELETRSLSSQEQLTAGISAARLPRAGSD